MSKCKHSTLTFTASAHAAEAGYHQRTTAQLQEAAQSASIQQTNNSPSKPSTFPAPLVLPGDELSFNPKYSGQTLQKWISGKYRNPVTPKRRIIYVVPPPTVSPEVSFANDWTTPQIKVKKSQKVPSQPKSADVLAYLQAFYHPLPVKVLSTAALEFIPWEDRTDKSSSESRIGLTIGLSVIGILTRPTPAPSLYSHQLNLNDLLDAAMQLLPTDAYALLMLTHHDLYEDPEDDFCCGRAYGGSRVSIVSTTRYNPLVDATQEVETEHAWPSSHCSWYMDAVCGNEVELPRKKQKAAGEGAMYDAVAAYAALPKASPKEDLERLWLGRVCRTASHELGHCFGMDHCVFYACVMQGTSGLSEDACQPPYLCPVDLAKVLYATGADEVDRYRALLKFCERFPKDRLFSSFAAWLKVRLVELGEVVSS